MKNIRFIGITDISVKQLDSESESTRNRSYFSGVIATGDIDRVFEVIDEKSLKAFAAALKKGDIPVYREHDHLRAEDPIGRAITGVYKDGKVFAEFYLRTDSTQGYKTAALLKDGTLSKLSAGYVNHKTTCVSCDEGIRGLVCKNGHYAGQVMPNGKRNSVIVSGAELIEFSVVGIPANMNTDVVSDAKALDLKGLLTDELVEYIDHTHPVELGLKSLLNSEDSNMENEETTEEQIDAINVPEVNSTITDELISQLNQANKSIADLQKRPSIDDVAELTKVSTKKISDLEVTKADDDKLIEAFKMRDSDIEKAMLKLKSMTKEAYIRANGITLRDKNDAAYKARCATIDKEESVYALIMEYVSYSTIVSSQKAIHGRRSGDEEAEISDLDLPEGYRSPARYNGV